MKPNCNLDHPLNKIRRLSTQRQMHKAITVFKSLHGLTPTYLSDQFTNRTDVTSYFLRDSVNKLVIPLPRTDFLKNSFSYSVAVLWNSLHCDLQEAESLDDFLYNVNSCTLLLDTAFMHSSFFNLFCCN